MTVAKVRRPRALWEDSTTGWQIAALGIPVSLGLHGILVVILVVQSFLSWGRPLPPPSYEVMLVGPIKKGTPGGGAPAAKAATAADSTKTETVKAPAATNDPKNNELAIPVPGKTDPKTAKADAIARMQKEAALRRAAELQAKSGIPAAAATPGSGANPIPAATAATGGSGEGNGDGGSEFGVDWSTLTGSATYEQQITAIAYSEFVPSLGSEKTPLQCIVRVMIGFDGTITATTIEESSGNPAFDASAKITFKKIGKFPPPPIELKPYLSKKGVPLRFHSQQATR